MPQLNEGQGTRGGGRRFSIRAEADRAEILLYDVIDSWYGISAKEIHTQLKALGEVSIIDLRIHSDGGGVYEGMAIHSILKRHPAKVIAYIDGIAASMASVVAMAADEIVMADGSYMMIHNPLGCMCGEAEDMRDYAELLDKVKGQLVNIYAARTERPADEIAELMDEETWFTAEEAVAKGFADRTTAQPAIAASIDPNRFNHVPEKLRGAAQMSQNQNQQTVTQNTAAAEPTKPVTPATPPALPTATGAASAPHAATYRELKDALNGADAEFVASQLDAAATLPQAQSAWMAEQNRRIEEANKATEDAKAQAETNKMGVEPLGGGNGKANSSAGGDPIAAYREALNAKTSAGMSRQEAVLALEAEQPELHQDYVEAINASLKKKT